MKYKAVIFDLDGTLLDTIEDIKETMNSVLIKYGYQTFSVEEYKYFVGKGVDHLIKEVMREADIKDGEFSKLKSGYYEVYKTQSKIFTKVYDGIKELITELKTMGLSINVLSNKPHVQTIDVIDYYFPKNTFNLVYGKKEEFLAKPAPDSALDIINKLNVKPTEVIYVGDTETDMFTAINSNFYSVGCLWGFRKKEELINAGADVLVEKPEEILKLIEE